MFECIKRAQVRWWIWWWHHFSSDLGSHVCVELLFQCGKKFVYVEEYEGFSSEQSTDILNGDLCCGCHFHWRSPQKPMWKRSTELGILHLTMFDHKRDLVMKSFWPVFVREPSYTEVRLSQSMCFVVGMISGGLVSWESCLFRWMCSLPYLEMFFWAKQNPCYTLEM